MTIQRSDQPVWCLSFCPQKFESSDNILITGAWDSKLICFQIQGGKSAKPIGSEKELGYDPCSISFFPKGDYFVMAGSDRKITLWNRDAVQLGQVGEMDDWVWSTSVNPKNNQIFS